MNLGTQLLQLAGRGFRAVRIVRAPLIVSVAAAIVLSVPDQTREIYRLLAQDFIVGIHAPSWFALLFGTAAGVMLWIIARNVTLIRTSKALRNPGFEGALLRWLPRVCGALIPFGMAIGLWVASKDLEIEHLSENTLKRIPQLKEIQDLIQATVPLLKFAAVIQLGFAVALLTLTYLRSRLNPESYGKPNRFLFGAQGRLLMLVGIAGTCTYFVLLPVAGPQLLGTIAIVLIFVIVLAFIASLLTVYFDKYGIPAISLLVLLAVLFSVMDWNDNHVVRMENLSKPGEFHTAPVVFKEWLKSRGDRDYYQTLGMPYPVFIVTASGGGSYAAYHAATVLTRLQDRCPNFAQHVFAISAVSGGGLGAAVFTSLVSRYAENGSAKKCIFGQIPDKGEFEVRAQKFLGADFVAPVVAAGLFPDLIQRLLPFPIQSVDRARALEDSFELAWTRAAPELSKDNPFAQPYFDLYRNELPPPGRHKRPTPALILNTTDVARGYRVVVAPFRVFPIALSLDPNFSGLTEFHELIGRHKEFKYDLRLSTAVGLSARFPWLSPAALARREDGSQFRLLDGGISDNSGIETASDLISQLDDQKEVRIHLIHIIAIESGFERTWQGLSEPLAPIRALLNARAHRGNLALFRADERRRQCATDPNCVLGSGQEFVLNLDSFRVPLGWQISQLTRRLVELHSGVADRESSTHFNPNFNTLDNMEIRDAIGISDGSACTIVKILTGATRPGKRFCEK